MKYKRKPNPVKSNVVHLDPIPLEVLLETLGGSFEREVYARQSDEIMELTMHPYVMETDVWGIQLYRLCTPISWENLTPKVQHAWIRKLNAMCPGV